MNDNSNSHKGNKSRANGLGIYLCFETASGQQTSVHECRQMTTEAVPTTSFTRRSADELTEHLTVEHHVGALRTES